MVEDQRLQALRDLADREREQQVESTGSWEEELNIARDEAVTWLHEVHLEQGWPRQSFARSAGLLDRFLSSCPGVRACQAQLAAVTCSILAFKRWPSTSSSEEVTAMLLEYADGAVLKEEVKVRISSHSSHLSVKHIGPLSLLLWQKISSMVSLPCCLAYVVAKLLPLEMEARDYLD